MEDTRTCSKEDRHLKGVCPASTWNYLVAHNLFEATFTCLRPHFLHDGQEEEARPAAATAAGW